MDLERRASDRWPEENKINYTHPVLISDKYVRWLYASSFVRDSLNRAKNESIVSNDVYQLPREAHRNCKNFARISVQ